MQMTPRLMAEFLGTLTLVATVVGSGIMAENLAGGNHALALLANTIATGAILFVIISAFAAISGAHFNPAVTMVMVLRGEMSMAVAAGYMLVQIIGGLCGTGLAHLMFSLDVVQLAPHMRSGSAQYLSEVVATFGLVMTIIMGVRHNPSRVPAMVALYITAAYWFTASTSFANPAVTIARTFTDSFSGIHYGDTGPFIIAQIIGAVLALCICRIMISDKG